jgi:hypothetical protein
MPVLLFPHNRRLSTPKPDSTAAACAIAFVLITVAVSFVAFTLIASPHTTPRMLHLLQVPVAMAAFATLSLSYGIGLIAGLGLFAAHRAGVHRLAVTETVRPPHVLRG